MHRTATNMTVKRVAGVLRRSWSQRGVKNPGDKLEVNSNPSIPLI